MRRIGLANNCVKLIFLTPNSENVIPSQRPVILLSAVDVRQNVTKTPLIHRFFHKKVHIARRFGILTVRSDALQPRQSHQHFLQAPTEMFRSRTCCSLQTARASLKTPMAANCKASTRLRKSSIYHNTENGESFRMSRRAT